MAPLVCTAGNTVYPSIVEEWNEGMESWRLPNPTLGFLNSQPALQGTSREPGRHTSTTNCLVRGC